MITILLHLLVAAKCATYADPNGAYTFRYPVGWTAQSEADERGSRVQVAGPTPAQLMVRAVTPATAKQLVVIQEGEPTAQSKQCHVGKRTTRCVTTDQRLGFTTTATVDQHGTTYVFSCVSSTMPKSGDECDTFMRSVSFAKSPSP